MNGKHMTSVLPLGEFMTDFPYNEGRRGQVFMVNLNGMELVMLDEKIEPGPLATVEDYKHGRPSFAHLYPNGEIIRFGKQIGTIDDLKVVSGVEPNPTPADDALEGFLEPGWFSEEDQLEEYPLGPPNRTIKSGISFPGWILVGFVLVGAIVLGAMLAW